MATVLSVDDAVDALTAGRVVILPTETVYGLACLPQPEPVAALFAAKHRPVDKSIQLLVDELSWLSRVGLPTADALVLARAFWPGPLTLVVAASPDAPAAVAADGTIGVRMPAHPAGLAVIGRAGPLAASSANRSGEPTPADPESVAAVFGDAVAGYVDGGRIEGAGSTVIDMTGARPLVLRAGPITSEDVTRALS